MNSTTAASAHDLGQALNANIRAELARRGIKLNTLARQIDVSTVTLHRRMSGSVAWNTTELAAVAQVLGVPVSDLFRT